MSEPARWPPGLMARRLSQFPFAAYCRTNHPLVARSRLNLSAVLPFRLLLWNDPTYTAATADSLLNISTASGAASGWNKSSEGHTGLRNPANSNIAVFRKAPGRRASPVSPRIRHKANAGYKAQQERFPAINLFGRFFPFQPAKSCAGGVPKSPLARDEHPPTSVGPLRPTRFK